jgi:Mg-chelatase subunit ChlD
MILLFLITPMLTYAGSGTITPAPANAAGIRGLMNFTINFRYVPTAADITNLQNEIRVANDAICDATDGQIVFGTVTITSGSVNEAQADIWILPDPGRSGVSFWSDGSGFGRDGAHINLFSNGIEGRVIAHELGHLAFGLGDEYDEQCRWGGACGIGPAFDAANIDDRNNTLMANHNTMSELSVPANHDPLQGDGSGCPATEVCTDQGPCTGDACNGFNGSTGRFETSQHTFIHAGQSEWTILAQNYPALGLTIPALPVAAVPAGCDGFLNIVTQTEGSSLVVLTFDRSGSMSVQDVGDRTRLEFAQAAGRAFVDLQRTKNIKLGIVEFSSTASTVRTVQSLTNANANAFKTDIDALTANGNTAIGDGLIESRVQLQIAQAVAAAGGETLTNPTVFLLSDGQNNRGADPDAVADNLISAGVTIHSIPVGNGADTELLSELASESGGKMLPAYSDDMIPAIYAELAAHQQGYSLINSGVNFKEHIFFEFPSPAMILSLPVEKNAEGLTIFMGLKNVQGTQLENKNIGRSVDIIAPDGHKLQKNEYELIDDAFYRIYRIPNPQSGIYQLFILNTQLVNPDLNVVSFVENPLPDFYIDAEPKVMNTPQVVELSGMASYAVTLFDPNLNFEGYVERPDRSQVPIKMEFDPLTGALKANFNAFNGIGSYKAVVRARVHKDAKLTPGESIFSAPSDFSIEVEPFVRVASTSFLLYGRGNCPPCGPDPKDCDGDGIRNEMEDSIKDQDMDGDGLPNRCDEDSDGDDIPDQKEGVLDLNQNGIPDAYDNPDLACNDSKLKIDVKVQDPDCDKNNGAIAVKVSGAKGKVAYIWSHDKKLNGPIAKDLPPFIYSVTVIDEAGCRRTATINLTEDCFVFEPSNDIPVMVNCAVEVPEMCEFPFVLTVDMTKAVAPNDKLGNFTGILKWDPAKVAYVGGAKVLSGFTGYINLDEVASGKLIFNGARAQGVNGLKDIFKATFQAIGPVGTSALIQVDFPSFAAANTFVDLSPDLVVQDCGFRIVQSGILGDVNGDGLVTSTDGNIILTFEVGKKLPTDIQELIKNGVGDVNQDGKTNARDALIILTYDAQLPTPYPVGEAVCVGGKTSKALDIQTRNIPQVDILLRPENAGTQSDLIDLSVTADLTKVNERLGSYKAVISWDPQALELLRYIGGHLEEFGEPTVNDEYAQEGRLLIAHANPMGMAGIINLFHLQFEELRKDGLKSLRVSFDNMTAAQTFTPLDPQIQAGTALATAPGEIKIFPNPFTDRVQLIYDLPQDTDVEITVHNLIGQQIAVLARGPQAKGTQRLEWQGEELDRLPSGLLLFKLKIGETITTRRVMYVAHD